MKYLFRLGQIILSVLFLIVSQSCQKEGDDIKIKKEKVSGYVQKGPYINGTAIQMYELNSSLNQTGKVFGTQIVNNKGSFEIKDIALTSQFVEFSANGYYFNEVTGDISPSQLSLYALSDITDISTVNVNILTHLEKSRVSFLVGQGEDFSRAKSTTQKEILAIFGLSLDEMVNSESLDISLNTEGNAILLAISIILQTNRSVGDLTELLANFITEIQQDGNLNDATIIPKLRNTTLALDLAKIRSNLETRYQNLGISTTIPGFEKYINDFLSFTGSEPTTSTQAATDNTITSATLNGIVNANDLSTVVTFEYGTTDAYGSSIAASPSPITGHINTSVSASLTDLNPGTQYHFRVKSENSLGTSTGNDITFKTLGQVPVVSTQLPTDITTTSATLKGLVNANYLSTNATFEYGTTTSYGSTIPASQNPILGNTNTNISAEITGLSPGTTYHFRIKAENSLGTNYSEDMVFNTIGLGGAPIVVIQQTTNIQVNSATVNGLINPNSFTTTVEFLYGTNTSYGNIIQAVQNPLTGSSDTSVSGIISDLLPGITYHFRIHAVNSLGETYSDDFTFTTLFPIQYFDNYYNIVTIGNQVWMAENLKTTKFNDGYAIPLVTDGIAWTELTTPAYCLYNNDSASYQFTYGALYNWYAINTGKLCPVDWHVPTSNEWAILFNYLGGENSGGKLKEAGTGHWIDNDIQADNSSMFTALPGGIRFNGGSFSDIGDVGRWWSSTINYDGNSRGFGLEAKSSWINAWGFNWVFGVSVRCIRDY